MWFVSPPTIRVGQILLSLAGIHWTVGVSSRVYHEHHLEESKRQLLGLTSILSHHPGYQEQVAAIQQLAHLSRHLHETLSEKPCLLGFSRAAPWRKDQYRTMLSIDNVLAMKHNYWSITNTVSSHQDLHLLIAKHLDQQGHAAFTDSITNQRLFRIVVSDDSEPPSLPTAAQIQQALPPSPPPTRS
jgi:hypothetical protein